MLAVSPRRFTGSSLSTISARQLQPNGYYLAASTILLKPNDKNEGMDEGCDFQNWAPGSEQCFRTYVEAINPTASLIPYATRLTRSATPRRSWQCLRQGLRKAKAQRGD